MMSGRPYSLREINRPGMERARERVIGSALRDSFPIMAE